MKNGAFAEYKIFTGNSHPKLAEEIAAIMGKPLGKVSVNTFSDGEISVDLWETVRGVDAYIVQPTCDPVNNSLMEILIMIDSMKRASAGRINAVIPYYGYARQDRKAKARDPITAKLVANLLVAAGADRVARAVAGARGRGDQTSGAGGRGREDGPPHAGAFGTARQARTGVG